MLYFAYGSNMNFRQMRERCPGGRFLARAYIEGYKFVYDGYSSTRKAAVGNIVPSPGDVVWGGLYEINDVDSNALDRYEGFPRSYNKSELDARDENGHTLKSIVYLRSPRETGKPSSCYEQTIFEGARDCGLPEEYVEKYLKTEHINQAATSGARSPYAQYIKGLLDIFWEYRERHFKGQESLFDRESRDARRPPVFNEDKDNILINENLPEELRKQIFDLIPISRRHRQFASMRSSQALAQSVFGTLKALDKIDCLADLKGDDGEPLFIRGQDSKDEFEMEKKILYIGEATRKTSIDVFFGGDHQVAVECKLSEKEVGACSRPRLRKTDEQYCNGHYAKQRYRNERCALTEIGVKYWKWIPLFIKTDMWKPERDHDPCPLRETYQMLRNVLAACLHPTPGKPDCEEAELCPGHAVLLYDSRNPEFCTGGKGRKAYCDIKRALKNDSLLQECTWQKVINAMSNAPELNWLIRALAEKYGLEPTSKL